MPFEQCLLFSTGRRRIFRVPFGTGECRGAHFSFPVAFALRTLVTCRVKLEEEHLMNARSLRRSCVALGIAAGTAFLSTNAPAHNARHSAAQSDAPLVVEGIVRQIYTGGDERDQLVEIEVRRSEARARLRPSTARYPAPAEMLYVHIASPSRDGENPRRSRTGCHAAGDSIRAYLKPRANGGWQEAPSIPGSGSSAITPRILLPAQTTADDVSATDPASRPAPQSSLGLTLERFDSKTVPPARDQCRPR